MKTRITEMLGIACPIIQGGMAWVAESHLAAAVSEAGGLGLIGAASAPAEVIRTYIREVRERTDKPFGVNVMLLSPYSEEVAKVIVEEKVPVVTTGAGNPENTWICGSQPVLKLFQWWQALPLQNEWKNTVPMLWWQKAWSLADILVPRPL